MIHTSDPYFKNRWLDKINPEQNEYSYCYSVNTEMADKAKVTALDSWDIKRSTKCESRYGMLDDTNTSTSSNKN